MEFEKQAVFFKKLLDVINANNRKMLWLRKQRRTGLNRRRVNEMDGQNRFLWGTAKLVKEDMEVWNVELYE